MLWGLRQQNTVLAVGNSIINRTATLDVGRMCLAYEGGGHHNAGTCQIANDSAPQTLSEVIRAINEDVYSDDSNMTNNADALQTTTN